MVGQEYEARLSKALLPRVTMEHLADLVNLCRTDRSCVIKTVAHRRHVLEFHTVCHCFKCDCCQLRRRSPPLTI